MHDFRISAIEIFAQEDMDRAIGLKVLAKFVLPRALPGPFSTAHTQQLRSNQSN
jgi:hypothetical protein